MHLISSDHSDQHGHLNSVLNPHPRLAASQPDKNLSQIHSPSSASDDKTTL